MALENVIGSIVSQGAGLGDFRDLGTAPSLSEGTRQFKKQFGDEAQLVEEQARFNTQQVEQQATAEEEQVLSAISQRGLGTSLLGQSQLEPILQRGLFQKSMAELAEQEALPEHRLKRTSQIRSELAAKSLTGINRQFQIQVQDFQRKFSELRQTTGSKITRESDRRNDQLQQRFDIAAADIMGIIGKAKSEGAAIGGGLGAILGGVAGFFIPGVGIAGGASLGGQLGSGGGSALGAAFNREKVQNIARRF